MLLLTIFWESKKINIFEVRIRSVKIKFEIKMLSTVMIVVVPSLSRVQFFATQQAASCLSLSPEFAQTPVHCIDDDIKSSHPPSPPSPLACIRIFSNESAFCIRWPVHWSFSIIPSNEYSRLISLRTEQFDLLAIQGTRHESSPAPQFESINSSALNHFLWSNSHIHTQLLEKTQLSLYRSLLAKRWLCLQFIVYNLSQLSRSKHLLISWLQSPLTVILQPKKIKSVTIFTFSPFYLP